MKDLVAMTQEMLMRESEDFVSTYVEDEVTQIVESVQVEKEMKLLSEGINDNEKNAIIVVGASTSQYVEMSPGEAKRAMAKNGYAGKGGMKPLIDAVEAYYIVPEKEASDLTATTLFFSNVDPEGDQLLYKLMKLKPVIVHTTSRGHGTDFGMRESNDFNDNVQALKLVFGEETPVYHFSTSRNDGWRYDCAISDQTGKEDGKHKFLFADYGIWQKVTIKNDAFGNDREVLAAEKVMKWPEYSKMLKNKESAWRDNYADFDAYMKMKSKRLGQNEDDVDEEITIGHDLLGRPVLEGDEGERVIDTGLTKQEDLEVLDSVLGQLSDGIWENSPAMEKYWPFAKAALENGKVVLKISKEYFSKFNGEPNGFRGMSDDKVKLWFADKVKHVVKQEWLDSSQADRLIWKRENTEKLDYMGGHQCSVTVRDAYRVYDKLKGRKDYIKDDPVEKDVIKELDKQAVEVFNEVKNAKVQVLDRAKLKDQIDKLKSDLNSSRSEIKDDKIIESIDKLLNWLDGYVAAKVSEAQLDEAQMVDTKIAKGVIRSLLWIEKLTSIGLFATGKAKPWIGKALDAVVKKTETK